MLEGAGSPAAHPKPVSLGSRKHCMELLHSSQGSSGDGSSLLSAKDLALKVGALVAAAASTQQTGKRAAALVWVPLLSSAHLYPPCLPELCLCALHD